MAYTLLGKLVWRGGRWYLRRRFPGLGRKLKLTGAGALAAVGAGAAISAARRPAGS